MIPCNTLSAMCLQSAWDLQRALERFCWQATDIQIVSEHLLKSKQRLNQILAQNTGKTVDVIYRDTERDHYMSAKEALEYGMIDKINKRYLTNKKY